MILKKNKMKKIWILSMVIFIGFYANAQEWITDFNQAKIIAKEEDKKLIMSFQGSDWCAPCIRLEQEFFSNSEFITYAKTHLVMLKVDFPRRKKNRLSKIQTKHNNTLAEKYNMNGNFPLVVVFNSEGKLVGKTGYNGNISVSEFIQNIENY